jgi:hypothetical protein
MGRFISMGPGTEHTRAPFYYGEIMTMYSQRASKLLLFLSLSCMGNDLVRAPLPPHRNQIERIHLDHEPGLFVVDRDITVGTGDQRMRLRIVVDLDIDPRIRKAYMTTSVYYRGRIVANKDVEVTWN